MEELARELLKKLKRVDYNRSDGEYAQGVRDTLTAIFGDECLKIGEKQTSLLDIHENLLKSEVF